MDDLGLPPTSLNLRRPALMQAASFASLDCPAPLRTRGGDPLDSTSVEPTGLSALPCDGHPNHARKKALANLFANLQ